MFGNTFSKKPRSNIVPGQRLPFNVALVQGGASPDNSYQNLSTEPGDVSQRNRPGRDYDNILNSFDNLSRTTSPVDYGNVFDVNMSSPNQFSGPISPKMFDRTSTSDNTTFVIVAKERPVRNRFPPTRFWLGERAVYNWRDGDFLRISPVFSENSLKSLKKDEASMRKNLIKSRRRARTPKITNSQTRNVKTRKNK